MPLVLLSSSGHYPDRLIEMTEVEIAESNRLQERTYLFDTPEGSALIAELRKRPEVPMHVIAVYQ